MKQKLFLFFTLISTCFFGQENVYYELRSPLNIVNCEKCIDVNPDLDINAINNITGFSNTYLELTQNNFIPIEFTVDVNGVVVLSKVNQNVKFSKEERINISKINELFKQTEGKKFVNFTNEAQKVATNFTLSFFYDSNDQKLILNPLTHK